MQTVGTLMGAVVAGAVVVWLGHAIGKIARDALRFQRIRSAFFALEHGAVLSAPTPLDPGFLARAMALRARSAVLIGQYRRCLDLLDSIEEDRRQQRVVDAGELTDLRVVALVGLGRYAEAVALGSGRATTTSPYGLCAQALIELGDDEAARRLLADPHDEPLHEATRQRILGELDVRRGDGAAGRQKLLDARRRFDEIEPLGIANDRGYCEVHLAEAGLLTGDLEDAERHVAAGVELISGQPDNGPGVAYSHATAAEIAAARQDLAVASAHLTAAIEATERCDSPPLRALVAFAAGTVALAAGRRAEAIDETREARDLLSDLGTVAPQRWQTRFDDLGLS